MEDFNVVEFLRKAVKMDSSNEIKDMREFILETLRNYNLDPKVDESGNIICRRGSGRPKLLLNTHMDTVRPHIKFKETENRILGRGSCDAKGPLASILKAFIESEIEGELILAITPDEETGTRGSYNLDLDFDSCIVGEPTELKPCNAARGVFKAEIKITGKSSHASEPEKGLNAISEASKVIDKLSEYDSEDFTDTKLPSPDLSATVIEGGEATNQIPGECKITLDRRNIPPEKPSDFIDDLERYLKAKIETKAEISVEENANTEYFLDAFETVGNAEILEILERETGNKSKIFDAATEASRFSEKPVVVFGPGCLADEEGGVAHSDREYVNKQEVRKASKILTSAVEEYLQ